MIITNYHVQHILKAYSQQLSVRSRISKDKANRNIQQRDEITISQESKKMLIVDKITQGIISQLTEGSERKDTGREILNRLSQEYGRPLDVAANNGQGIAFRVLSEKGDGVIEYLSSSENEQLKNRLFDITRSMVYKDLI